MNEDKAGEPFRPRILFDDASIPEAILRDPTLSVGARLLWGILAAYQRNGECSPLEEALAVDLGVKVRQLQSYLKELENYTRGDPPEAVPLLAVSRVWVEKDRKTRNSYTLLGQPFLGVAPKEAGTTRGHLVNGGDAQSLAYRSGENAPNTDPAPPGIPNEDGGVVPTDMSPSIRNPRLVGMRARRNILLLTGLQFPLNRAAQRQTVCHRAMRNMLRIGLGGTRSSQPFPGKIALQFAIVCHGAIRNLLRIGPRASRKRLLLGSLPFSVKTATRCRTPCSPTVGARTS
jgi:hypothetical protein